MKVERAHPGKGMRTTEEPKPLKAFQAQSSVSALLPPKRTVEEVVRIGTSAQKEMGGGGGGNPWTSSWLRTRARHRTGESF